MDWYSVKRRGNTSYIFPIPDGGSVAQLTAYVCNHQNTNRAKWPTVGLETVLRDSDKRLYTV